MNIEFAYSHISLLLKNSGNILAAIEAQRALLKRFENRNDLIHPKTGVVEPLYVKENVYLAIADLYQALSKYKEAIQYYEEAQKVGAELNERTIVLKKLSPKEQFGRSYIYRRGLNKQIADCYFALGEYQKALEHYLKLEVFYKENGIDPFPDIPYSRNFEEYHAFVLLPKSIGDCYNSLGKYQEALEQYKKALQYTKRNDLFTEESIGTSRMKHLLELRDEALPKLIQELSPKEK